jgi:hypothetical protein
METEMKKEEKLSLGIDTTGPTRDGRFSMLTKPNQYQRKDSVKILASTSTDHSTLFPDFQCTELLRLLELAMLLLRDMSREELLRLGSLITRTRLSEAITGRTIACKFQEAEHTTSSR